MTIWGFFSWILMINVNRIHHLVFIGYSKIATGETTIEVVNMALLTPVLHLSYGPKIYFLQWIHMVDCFSHTTANIFVLLEPTLLRGHRRGNRREGKKNQKSQIILVSKCSFWSVKLRKAIPALDAVNHKDSISIWIFEVLFHFPTLQSHPTTRNV